MQGHSIHSHQTPASSVQKDNATSFQNLMVDKLNSSKNRKMNAKQRGNNQEKNDINVGNKTKCNSLPLSAFPLGGYSHSDSDYPKLLAIHNMFKGDLTTFRVDPVELFESNENETNQDTQVNSTCCSKTLCLHCSLENEISMLPKRTQLQSSSGNDQPMKKNQISSNNESTCSSRTTDTSSNIKNPTQIPSNQQNISNIPTKNKKKTKKLENNIVSPRNDSYVRPNDNHTRPNFNHTQPSINQIRMNGSYIRPENNPSQTYNGEPRGIIGYIRPNFNQAQLNDIHMRPNFYHVRPNLNQVRQSFDHFQATPSLLPPNALHNRPQNDQYRQNSKNSPTVYNHIVQFRQFSPDNINQQNGPVQPQYVVVNRMMTPQVNNFPHSKSLGFPNENQNRPRVHPPNLIDMRIVKASLPSSSSDVLKSSERLIKSSNGQNPEKVDNSNTNLPPGNSTQPMQQETNSKKVTNQNSDRVSSNQKSTSETTSDNSSTINKHDKHRKCNLPSLNNEKQDDNSSPIRTSKENTDSNSNKKINSNDFSAHNKTNILNEKNISNINNEVSKSGVQNLDKNSTVEISTKKSEGRRSEPLSEIDFNEIGIFIPSFQDEKNIKEVRSLEHSAQKDSPNQEKFRESSFSKSSEHTTDIKQKGNSIEAFETELIVPRLNNLRTDNDEDLIVPRSVESDGRSQEIEEGNSRRQIDGTREKTFTSNIEREYFRDIKVKLEEMDGVDISDKSNNCTEKNWNENQSITNSNISMNSNEKRHEKSGRDIKRQFEKLHKTFEKSSKTSNLEIHSSDTSEKPRSMIKELKEITNDNMEQENDVNKEKSKNIEQENELRKTVSQSIEYENGINRIKANSNDHEKDRSKIRSKNIEHENELSKTVSQSIEYENGINKIKANSNDHGKDRSKIRSKNIEHENELRKTVSQSIEYKNDINKTKLISNDHEKDRSKIRLKNIEYENELRKTESQSIEYENGINKIKANSNDHEKDRSKIKSKNIEHENELRKTVSQSIEYENEINKTKSISNDHEKDRRKIRSKNIEHENEFRKTVSQIIEYENDINKTRWISNDHEKDRSKIESKNIEHENVVCEKANEIKVNNNIRSKSIEGGENIKNKAELNHMERKDQANKNIKSRNVGNKIIFRYEIKPKNIKRLDMKSNVSHEKRFICNISNSIERKDNLENVTNQNSDRVLSNKKTTSETTSNDSSTIDKHDKHEKEILASPIRTNSKTTNIRSKENASNKNIHDDSSPISSKTMNRDDFSAQMKTNFLNEKNITDTSFVVSKSGVQKNHIEKKDNLKPKIKIVELKDKMDERINNNEMTNVGNIKNIAISDKGETIEKTDNNIEDKDNKTTEQEKLVNKEKLHVEVLSKTKKKEESENFEEKIDSNENNIIFNIEIEDNDKTGKQKEHLDIKLVTKLDANLHKNKVLMDKIEEVNSDQGKAFDNKSKAQLRETCIKNSITTVENLDKKSGPSTSDENCHLKKSDQNISKPGTIITSLKGQSMDLDKHNDKIELKRHQNTIFDHNHNSDQVNTSETLCLNNKKTINEISELDQRTQESIDSSMNTKPSNSETVSGTQSSSKIFRKRFIKENKTDSCCQNKSSNFDHLRVIRQRKLYKLLSDISTSEPLYKKSKVQEKTISSMKSVPLDTKHNENKDHKVESDHAKTSDVKIVPKLPQNDSRTLERDKTSLGNIVSLPDDVETCNNLDFYNTLLLTVFENTPLLSKDSVSETSNYENIAYNVLNSTIANIVPLMNIESKANKQSTNEELQSEKMNDFIVEKLPNYNELTTENTTEKYMVALATDKNELKNKNTTENIVTLSHSNKDIGGLKNKSISKESIGTLSNSNQVTDELATKDTKKETIVILSTSNENMNIINTENPAEKDMVKSSTIVKDKDEVTNRNTTEKIVTLSHSKKDIDGLKNKNISEETIGTLSNPNQLTDELPTKDTEKETIVKSLISDRDKDKLASKNTSDEHILMLSTSNSGIPGLIIESASKETVETLSTSNQVTDRPTSENTKNETIATLSTFSENMDLLNTEKTSEKDIVKSLTSDENIDKLTNKNTSEEDIVTFSTSNENINERTIENISKETIETLSNFNQDIDAVTTEKNPKEIVVTPSTSKKDTDKLRVDNITRKDLVTISISNNDINEPTTKNTKEENIPTSSTSYKDSVPKNMTEKDNVALDKGIDNSPAKNTIGENLIRLSTSDKDVSEITTENINEANIKVSSTSKDVKDKFVSENSKEKVIQSIDVSSENANSQLFPTSDTIVTLCTSNLNECQETPLSYGQKWMKRINAKNSSSPFSDIKFDGKYVSLSLNVKKRLGKIIDSALIDNYDTIVELENTIKDSICQKLFQNLNVDSPLSPKVSRTEGNDSYNKTDDTDVLEIKIKQEICDDTPTEISDQEDSLVTNYLKAKTRPCFVKLIDYKKNPLDGINIKTEPSDNGNDNDEVFGNKTNHREDSVEILLEKQQRLKKKRKHYSLCSCSDDGDRDCCSCKQSVDCSETKTKKMKKCKCKGEKRRKSAGDVLHSKEKKSHNGNVDPIKFRLMQEKWRNIFG